MIDLPPDWIIRAAKTAMNKTNRWTEAMSVFCAYYDVPKLHCLHEPQRVPKGAIACYIPNTPNTEAYCYSKEKEVSTSTMFHELGHHLNHLLFKQCRLTAQANEAFAEIFSDEMTKKWDRFT